MWDAIALPKAHSSISRHKTAASGRRCNRTRLKCRLGDTIRVVSGILFCTSGATEDAVNGTLSLTLNVLAADDEQAGGGWLRDLAGLRTSDDLSRPPRRTCRYMRGGRPAHALDAT